MSLTVRPTAPVAAAAGPAGLAAELDSSPHAAAEESIRRGTAALEASRKQLGIIRKAQQTLEGVLGVMHALDYEGVGDLEHTTCSLKLVGDDLKGWIGDEE